MRYLFLRRCRLVLIVAAASIACGSAPIANGQYEGDIGRWKAQDALDMPEPGAVLFIGSSSIRRWEQMSLDFADYNVLQRGFGGAHLDHLVEYVNDIVLPYHPRAIVVWAGTNDIASGDSGAEVFEDYREFVGAVHREQPGVDIFYLGIAPTPGREDNRPREDIANASIRRMAADHDRLHYIDLPAAYAKLNPYEGPAFTSKFADSIHLNRDGYDLWTRVIRPEIEAVVAPDKVYRPNPDAPGPGSRILFDFGPSNPDEGEPTTSPDLHGNHWNNWHEAEGGDAVNAGEHIGNLVDARGRPTGIELTITGGFRTNGKRHGGLSSPETGLLGDLAVSSATVDYFYCTADDVPGGGNEDAGGGFMLGGLDPNLTYDLYLFGSRNAAETRITEYLVIGASRKTALLRTCGNNIGADGAYDGNDDQVAMASGVRPDRFGQVFVDMTVASGRYAYLNAMRIVVAPAPRTESSLP